MPPPRTTSHHKTAPRMHAPPHHQHQQQHQHQAYPFRSADLDTTLRDSTRYNSTAGSSRSGSSSVDTYIRTPQDQSKATMQDVDIQFDQLLVGLEIPDYISPGI